MYKIGQVAKLIGKSAQTIRLWYKAEAEGKGLSSTNPVKKLPEPTRGKGGHRYFSEEDVKQLKDYSENIERGSMAKFNAERQYYKPVIADKRKKEHKNLKF